MAFDLIILLGFIFIAIGALITLPVVGVGSVLPGVGDVIDIPIAAVMILVGMAMVIIGGLGYLIATYWWVVAIGIIALYITSSFKIGIGMKRRRS